MVVIFPHYIKIISIENGQIMLIILIPIINIHKVIDPSPRNCCNHHYNVITTVIFKQLQT